MASVEIEVLGGMVLEAIYTIHPAEPDVGISTPEVELLELRWLTGDSIENRLYNYIIANEEDSVIEQIEESLE